MSMKMLIPVGTALLLAGLAGCEREVSYTADVQPIFDSYCVQCHTASGEGAAASGFVVDNYDTVMKGTNFGPVVVPGSSMSSSLYLVVASKTDPNSPYWNEVRFRAAELSACTHGELLRWSGRLFERLNLRDYGRFDFRANAKGEIKLLEVNPNPAWCHDGKLAHMAHLAGEDHATLLRRILESTRVRLAGEVSAVLG